MWRQPHHQGHEVFARYLPGKVAIPAISYVIQATSSRTAPGWFLPVGRWRSHRLWLFPTSITATACWHGDGETYGFEGVRWLLFLADWRVQRQPSIFRVTTRWDSPARAHADTPEAVLTNGIVGRLDYALHGLSTQVAARHDVSTTTN